MLAWTSVPCRGSQNFSSRATFGPAGHKLHIPVLGFWKNEHRFPCLKAAARELSMAAISAPSERVFGVAMLCRPEPGRGRRNQHKSNRNSTRPDSLSYCCNDFNVMWCSHHDTLATQANCTARNAPILSNKSLLFSCLWLWEWIHILAWVELGLKLLWFEQM